MNSGGAGPHPELVEGVRFDKLNDRPYPELVEG